MKSFIVARDEIRYSNKAISLPIGRNGNYPIVERSWFPLSVVSVKERNLVTEIQIPEWLISQKCSDGYKIIEIV